MTTTNNGEKKWQNWTTIINCGKNNLQSQIKQYNFPDEIWDIIREYMGIGNLLCMLMPLTIKQLKNLTYFAFMYPDKVPPFCPINTNKSNFISIILVELETKKDIKLRDLREGDSPPYPQRLWNDPQGKIEFIKMFLKEHRHDLQSMHTHKDQLELMNKAYSIRKCIAL